MAVDDVNIEQNPTGATHPEAAQDGAAQTLDTLNPEESETSQEANDESSKPGSSEEVQNGVVPVRDVGPTTRPNVAAKAPIIFVDPIGTRWSFPFETAKTWEGMKLLIKKVFYSSVGSWYYHRINLSDDGERGFSIIRLTQKSNILIEHWDQMVEPGWQVKMQFEGESGLIQEAIEERAKEAAKNAADKAAEAEKEENSEAEARPDIIYVAKMYQQDGTRYPGYLHQKTYREPLAHHVLPGEASSVLCEVRNVFLSVSKMKLAQDSSYDRIQSDDIIDRCVLEIHSTILLNVLKAVIQFQSIEEKEEIERFRLNSQDFTDLQSGTFVFPFLDLYHHKDELIAYKSRLSGPRQRHTEEYNKECDRHINILVKYLYDQPTIGLSKAEAAWSRKVPVTTFSWLWLLLKPGSDVYVRERGQLNAYVVESLSGTGRNNTSRAKPYEIKVWNLDFDGKSFGRSSKIIFLPVFDGEREIQSLSVFPVRFHQDKEGEKPLRDVLIERGRTFVKVVKQATHQEYTGPSTFHTARTFTQARVIVDHTSRPWENEMKTYQVNKHIPKEQGNDSLGLNTRAPSCQCAVCAAATSETLYQRVAFDDYDDINIDSTTELTEHQYFLCWSHVYAYALQDRLWDLMEVRGLKAPRIDKNVIDTLVMRPDSNKAMVKAICETYSQKGDRENLFFADYIRGKGEGQIILLHGPPGTGKTLTAESVAEYTGRPLLSITAADLGHEPEDLEPNLLRFFRNANIWDAIVLLDEADVYLERRSTNEMRRNSIVSIFLRALDYFQGILFLTTNRVGSFDEAFMSRIHVQIGYEPLDDNSRQQIWINSFKKLASNHKQSGREIRYSLTAKEFVMTSPKLKALKWNGREIRNAFQTAVALASFEAKQNEENVPTVTEDHFSQVVEMSTSFKEYMRSALQDNDADLAFRNRLRNDSFKLVPVER